MGNLEMNNCEWLVVDVRTNPKRHMLNYMLKIYQPFKTQYSTYFVWEPI